MTVDSKFAGKTGKCSKCGGVLQVPAQSPSPTGQASRPQPAQPARPSGPLPSGPSPSRPLPSGPSPSGPSPLGQAKPQIRPNAAGAAQAVPNAAPPPSITGIKVSGPLNQVLDELTESDFNRTSPFQQVYAPPKPKAEKHELLERAAKQDDDEKKIGADGRPELTSTLKIYGVLDIIEAMLCLAITMAIGFVGVNIPEDVAEEVPFVNYGLAFLIVILGLASSTMLAAGLGIFSKEAWGYYTALTVYSFQLGGRLALLLMSIAVGGRMLPQIFLSICILACTSYFWTKECREVYGIPLRSKVPLIVSSVVVCLQLLPALLLMLVNLFASPTIQEQPLP